MNLRVNVYRCSAMGFLDVTVPDVSDESIRIAMQIAHTKASNGEVSFAALPDHRFVLDIRKEIADVAVHVTQGGGNLPS